MSELFETYTDASIEYFIGELNREHELSDRHERPLTLLELRMDEELADELLDRTRAMGLSDLWIPEADSKLRYVQFKYIYGLTRIPAATLALKQCSDELLTLHLQFGDLENAYNHSAGLRLAHDVLKEYE